MDTTALSQLGLTTNEIEVYVTLLKLGLTKSGPIIEQTGISSSQVYYCLNTLIEQSLVTFENKNNIKYYVAKDPTTLLEQHAKNAVKLKKTIHHLQQLQPIKKNEPISKQYFGTYGFKSAYEFLLQQKSTNDGLLFIGFPYHLMNTKLLYNLELLRIQHGIPQIIITNNLKYKQSLTTMQHTSTLLPDSSICIYNDYIMTTHIQGEPIVTLIQNKKTADMYRRYAKKITTQ